MAAAAVEDNFFSRDDDDGKNEVKEKKEGRETERPRIRKRKMNRW